MLSYYTITLAAFASTALANGIDVIDVLGVSPVVDRPDTLNKREDVDCAVSVISSLLPDIPTQTDFVEWAETAGPDRILTGGCEFTVPATLSDEFLSFFSGAQEWAETVSAEAAKATDCGIEGLALEFSAFCSTSQTIYFEGATTAFNGSVPSTLLDNIEFPEETIMIGTDPEGAASVKKALVGPAVALTLFLGAVAAL